VSWPFERPCSLTYTCDVAFSRKEMTWILKSTKSPNNRKSSPSGVLQRAISYVKSASNLMICGSTWFPNHRWKQNVSCSLPQSLPTCLGCLSQLHSGIYECSRVAALDRCWSTHLIAINYLNSLSNCNSRPTAVIYGPWMHKSGVR